MPNNVTPSMPLNTAKASEPVDLDNLFGLLDPVWERTVCPGRSTALVIDDDVPAYDASIAGTLILVRRAERIDC